MIWSVTHERSGNRLSLASNGFEFTRSSRLSEVARHHFAFNSVKAFEARFQQVTTVSSAATENIRGQASIKRGAMRLATPNAPTTKARSLLPIGPSYRRLAQIRRGQVCT